MYFLVHGRGPKDCIILDAATKVSELTRGVSGDIVATRMPDGTFKPIKKQPFFDWEKKDKNCYIRKLIREGWKF